MTDHTHTQAEDRLRRACDLTAKLCKQYADEAHLQTKSTRYAAKVGFMTAFIATWAARTPAMLEDLERQVANVPTVATEGAGESPTEAAQHSNQD